MPCGRERQMVTCVSSSLLQSTGRRLRMLACLRLPRVRTELWYTLVVDDCEPLPEAFADQAALSSTVSFILVVLGISKPF